MNDQIYKYFYQKKKVGIMNYHHNIRGTKEKKTMFWYKFNYAKCKFCIIEGVENKQKCVFLRENENLSFRFWTLVVLLELVIDINCILLHLIIYIIIKAISLRSDIAFNILARVVPIILPFRWQSDKRFYNLRFLGSKAPRLQAPSIVRFCLMARCRLAGAVIMPFARV